MLQNFKIKTKIIGMASLLVVGILITSIVGIYQERKLSTDSLNSLEKAMRSDYDDEIKNRCCY